MYFVVVVKNTLSYLYLASINLIFLFYRNVSTLRSSNKNRSETYQGNTRQPVMLHIWHGVSKVFSFWICKWRCIKLYSAFYLLKRIAIEKGNPNYQIFIFLSNSILNRRPSIRIFFDALYQYSATFCVWWYIPDIAF